MVDAALHLPASFLHEAFSNRSGVPLEHFELYYRGKRLEGEAALVNWGIGKGSTVEVKMRGRGGADNQKGKQPQKPDEGPSSSSAPRPSPSHVEAEKKLSQKAKDAGEEGETAAAEIKTAEAMAEKARLEGGGGGGVKGVGGVRGAEAGNAAAGNVANKLDLEELAKSSECDASAKVSTA